MRSLTSGILAAAALCLGAFTHSQARAETGCPGTLDVQQRAEPPAGWSVSYSEQPPRLSGVTLYDGPPANLFHGPIRGRVVDHGRGHIRSHFSQRVEAAQDHLLRVVGDDYSPSSQK